MTMRNLSIVLTLTILIGGFLIGTEPCFAQHAEKAGSSIKPLKKDPRFRKKKKVKKRRIRKLKRTKLHVKVEAIVALKQRTEKPTFTQSRPFALMNRGAYLYYGKGMWTEQQTFYLMRLKDLKPISVQAPFNAYVKANPGMKVDPNDQRPMNEQFFIKRLLYYDETNQEAAFEVSDAIGVSKTRRHFLMQWDLKKNEISGATLVARSTSGKNYTHLLPLGYDLVSKEFSYVRQIINKKSKRRRVYIIGFKANTKPRVIAEFVGERSMSSRSYFDPVSRRALLVEYAELAYPDPPPKGYLIDMQSGKVLSFPIPLTTYGVSFSSTGKIIYTYSSQLGQLWQIDAETGKKIESIKIGKLGHAMGAIDQGMLLIRNNGLREVLLKQNKLKLGQFIPIKTLYQGFSHVGGSLVAPGRALIRNGDKLYIVALSRGNHSNH